MITLLVLLIAASSSVSCVCYFPMEYQGIFATQSSISTISGGSVHQYSEVTILPDAIPVWGVCHKKFDNNVVLRDPTGGQDCFRCFHVSLHSGNVIQIYTEGLNKCYSTEEAAVQTCPTMHDIQIKRAREIMLYKSRSFTQDGLIDRVFCPINGRYRFTYDVNDGTESSVECPEPTSELSNCPKGSELQLRFRRCSFGELTMGLRCLGDWEGQHDGKKYLALWDPEVTTDNQPRYRCAMYSIEETTGRVYLSFSIDATCTNHLHSPWDGYETMVLTPVTPMSPPAVAQTNSCTFPQWAKGTFQNLQIKEHDLWLQDDTADKKYKTLCLSQHAPHGERYALYSQTQCGDEEFTCIWIKRRAANVIEYQISFPSQIYNASRVCSDDMFRGQVWNTQGRLDAENQSSCPITGEYTGVIPDAKELCARLSSDCEDPQHMYYTVASCFNASEVYEEREYRCLGQWSEGGVMYTFTHREDVNIYECFAGVVVNSHEIFIIEAGTSCQRGLQPLAHGMKLVRQATCSEIKERKEATAPTPTDPSSSRPPWWPPTTGNPWVKKVSSTTEHPTWNNEISRAAHSSSAPRSLRLWTRLAATALLLVALL